MRTHPRPEGPRYASLFEVPGFDALRPIANRFDVRFVLIGSTCRRIMMSEVDGFRHEDPYDLFDFAPFASDVDLLHSGTPEQSAPILEAIRDGVPAAHSFRWEVRSFAENAPFWDAVRVGNVVPFDLVTLASDSTYGLHDRWNARADFERRTFRYVENGFADTSELLRTGRDLLAFTAISYLRGLLEAHAAALAANPAEPALGAGDVLNQPALESVANVCQSSCNVRVLRALNESAYLRARLWYRLRKLSWATPSPELLTNLANAAGLAAFVNYLSDRDPKLDQIVTTAIGESGKSGLMSPSLGGDLFRLPTEIDGWASGADADALLERLLPEGSADGRDRAVLASSPIPVTTGLSASSEPASEFVHFEIPLAGDDGLARVPVGELALAVGIGEESARGGGRSVVFTPPALFWRHGAGENASLLVRANCLQILAEASNITDELTGSRTAELRFFVLVPEALARA